MGVPGTRRERAGERGGLGAPPGSLQGVDELELFRGFGNDGYDVDTLEITRPRRSTKLRRLRLGHPVTD